MARPTLPTAVKKLKGTLQPCRTNPDEPILPVEVPNEDKSLAHLSPEARLIWPDFADILSRMGVLTMADGPAMGLLVEAFVDGIRARRTVEREGYTYECVSEKGGTMIRPHPAVAQAADADRRFAFWCNQFGLTPAARSRVSANLTEKAKNEFEEI
jgi:P27 family predicted phage terminase small subunit